MRRRIPGTSIYRYHYEYSKVVATQLWAVFGPALFVSLISWSIYCAFVYHRFPAPGQGSNLGVGGAIWMMAVILVMSVISVYCIGQTLYEGFILLDDALYYRSCVWTTRKLPYDQLSLSKHKDPLYSLTITCGDFKIDVVSSLVGYGQFVEELEARIQESKSHQVLV